MAQRDWLVPVRLSDLIKAVGFRSDGLDSRVYPAAVVGHQSWSGTTAGGSSVDGVGAPMMFGLKGGHNEMCDVEAEMMAS